MRSRFIITFGACFAVCLAIRSFGDSPNEGVEFFEKKIRPLLIDKCFECHSQEKKIKGGLALDSRDSLRRGGDNGAAVVAGDPEASLLIEAVRYRNRDLQMPPDGPLSDEQVHDLEKWIGMGAPDPRVNSPANEIKSKIDIETARRFWSFSPLSDPEIPSTKNQDWVQTPIDAFVLEGLEKVGLTPAPPADKRTLIRRATFDLIGLPPTPEEIQAFLDDDSFEAFHTVVDRLLASPHYGERWGRHWLDVARYADSNGMDENVAYGHAWRYRDYVVQSLNNDKPFDRFLIEQIAGDLLPSDHPKEREQYLAATGFLALGARVLAEPDMRKLEMDIVDEQLDTIGKAFLGMTFGCARCHDHKFDPISQADYYAAAAIFRSTRSLSDFKKGAIKFWYQHSLATKEELEAKAKHEALVKERTSQLAKLSKETRNELKAELHSRAADYLAAAVEPAIDSDYASVQRIAMQHGLRPRYLLTCRQYLDRNPDHPFFAFWRASLSSRNVEAVREHYASLFSQAASRLAVAQAENPKADRPLEPELAAALDALNDAAGFLAIPEKDADAFDGAMLKVAEQMKAELNELEEQTPDPPAVMGVCDGAIVGSLPIHIRGSYLTLGENVERDFPAVMKPVSTKPVFPSRESGRLQLAQWMASSEHPLTARVFVNRMWRWHFGRGLVCKHR